MQCSLYSSDGPLMGSGRCEVDGSAIRMVVEEWHMTPQEGGPALTLVNDDGTRLPVRVEQVRVLKSDPERGHTEEYRLVPLREGAQEERV